MLSSVFYWVLNMSILGTAAGVVVMLLRRFRKLPRFGIYFLWLLPFIRFWIPFGFSFKYSLLNLISRYTTKTIVVWEALPHYTFTNSFMAAESYFPIEYKTNLLKNIFNAAGLIWVIVAGASILCSMILYITTKSALKDAKHIKNNIYCSGKVLSPAVYGIINPKIIVPNNISETDLDYILTHEGIHIRRHDNLFRAIAVITACIHWFNPFAWVFLRCFFTDMELACDTGVLKKLNDNEKKSYALALLSYSGGKTFYASAFGGAKTQLRIKNILSYKKLTLMSGIFASVFLISVAIIIITNAVGG